MCIASTAAKRQTGHGHGDISDSGGGDRGCWRQSHVEWLKEGLGGGNHIEMETVRRTSPPTVYVSLLELPCHSQKVPEFESPPLHQSASPPIRLVGLSHQSIVMYRPFACNPPGVRTESADKMPVTPRMPFRVMNTLSCLPLRSCHIRGCT